MAGNALLAHGVISRPTQDVDLFTDQDHGVEAAAGAVEAALRDAGFEVERQQDAADLAEYDVTAGTVAAQLDVDGKHNEITYFADLLACLDTPGTSAARDDRDDSGGGEEDVPFTLITADALHTQTAHVKAMNAAGLDWILITKGNQAGLEDEICSFDWESFPPQHITDETGHGRHDVRVIRAAPAPESLTARWPGIAQIFLAERYRHPRTRAMGDIGICTAAHPAGHDAGQNLIACARELGAKMSCEAVTGITSLTPAQAGPADLLTCNRGHWAIENGLHHRRHNLRRRRQPGPHRRRSPPHGSD